jgi:adenylosuccinate lyase
VEIEYFIALTTFLKLFDVQKVEPALRAIYQDFTEADAQRIKDIEKVTNHDVKAVEYFIKEKFDEMGGLEPYKEFIHFGLTSQDINNTSVPLSIKEALEEVYYPMIEELIAQLQEYAAAWKDIPMLAKTHGQPASPTRLGKEVMVYVYRLTEQLNALKSCKISAKFGGATGNYNAHHVAYPQIDWKAFGNQFVSEKLGLEREQWTTQISNYDNLGAVFNAMERINTIMIDLDRDFWMYVSMEYFKQKIKAGEVGSSAMPHKVNPIDFENSEGNLGIANAILSHLATKLPVSRLQRDLTDSTVLRNVGVPMGHMVIAIQSSLKGLRKLLINEAAIQRDLDNCWAVCAEGIQTILRREGYPHPYEALKALTRTNNAITQQSIADFIEGLEVSEQVKEELRQITPNTYFGL